MTSTNQASRVGAIAVGVVVLAGAGAYGAWQITGADKPATSVVDSSKGKTYQVWTEYAEINSVNEAQRFTDAIVRGEFVAVSDTDVSAQDLGLASDQNDAIPLEIWEFRVDQAMKGSPGESVRIVRFKHDVVQSNESPISVGTKAVLLLGVERDGYRSIVAGDGGFLDDADGVLTRRFGPTKELNGAASVQQLEASLR